MSSFNSGQIILVTGASSGIGRACAMALNAAGAFVAASGRNVGELESLAGNCRHPQNMQCEPQDLAAEPEFLPDWISSLRRKYGRLYGLCHCAGTGRLDSIRALDLPDAREYWELSFFVPLMLAKGFCDRRNFQKGGAMLFMSSASAIHPEKGHVLYGSAKAALACAVKSISQEMASLGLRANCVAPGLVSTPMLEAASRTLGPDYLPNQAAAYPLGLGKPEDVADMAVFLLSEKARWITGQNFLLDGGRY